MSNKLDTAINAVWAGYDNERKDLIYDDNYEDACESLTHTYDWIESMALSTFLCGPMPEEDVEVDHSECEFYEVEGVG